VWVYDPVSGRADSRFADAMLSTAGERGWRVAWVLETHAHADHLSAAGHIRSVSGASIAIGRGICAVQETFRRVFNLKDVATDGSQFDRLLDDGDTLALGALQIRVMATPGHTSDSVTYLLPGVAFVGDTLFSPAYGTARCDFPGGDASQLYDSIQRLYQLPADTRLYLCHDYPKGDAEPLCMVSVAESREHNIHLRQSTGREQYVAMRTERDRQLSLPRLILPALQVNIRAGAAPAEDDNGVSYLRLPFNRSIAEILAG
jgi:glyoxylase-like metal-dependent hydrolase (beta-lactamase superfamily II)